MRTSLKITAIATVAIVISYITYASYVKPQATMSEIMLANIDALARGEDGTATSICYKIQASGNSTWQVFCDERTSDSMIYPCIKETHNYYSEYARDRCTK